MAPGDATEAAAAAAAAAAGQQQRSPARAPRRDLHHDEVPVDRRKLERMIAGGDENLEPAEVFFRRIMQETDTRIFWPCHLKIGGKSRKTPRVHFAGALPRVLDAMKRVREVLAVPDDRVTLKLDVSHAFHSHIIGRGGAQVQRLMQETGAHVHFPDCNRAAAAGAPRSNLVSAAGRLRDVERARQRLREMMPLLFYMDVCVGEGAGEGSLAAALAAAAAAQRTFAVSVRARPRASGGGGAGGGGGGAGALQLQLRGPERDLPRLRAACASLARQLRGETAREGATQVYATLQMSPSNQGVALGRAGETLRRIADSTGARLAVPERDDASVQPSRRGAVSICGALDAVFLARQQLLGSLPLKLVFDIPEHLPLDGSLVTQLTNVLGVNITTFQKEKQHLTTVTIRGIERYATNIYEARRILLALPESPVIAEIPETYHISMKADILPMPTSVTMLPTRHCSGTSGATSPILSSPTASPMPSTSATGSNGLYPGGTVQLTDSGYKGIYPTLFGMLNNNDFMQNYLIRGNSTSSGSEHTALASQGNNAVNASAVPSSLQANEERSSVDLLRCFQDSHFGVDSILYILGLQKYIELFHAEEIDWPVFQTLNDQDLINIGITTYGARRKILGVISALKKAQVPFSGSAAPGAERKGAPEMLEHHAHSW